LGEEMIAKVEPLTTARALRGPFDYLLSERFAEVEVGTVLRVPFGPRRVLGVVVEIAEQSAVAPERLAEPIEALEAGVSPELVRLGLWIGREYCSTPARGLELVLPPGTASARGQTRALTETVAVAVDLAEPGARAGLGRRQLRALELLDGAPEGRSAAELAAEGIGRDALRRLERRGLVELRDRAVRRRPQSASIGAADRAVVLDPAQRAAVARISAALDGDGGELLLHGVTGSGKTEVYLAAAQAALERGRGAIVLVPEIGLTPQATSRFASRFGDRVAVLHSRLSAGERRDEWHRLAAGEARICVGPRSAVFAPIEGLGLIVVDEEHDSSYKQESDPRYDAREVAVKRAADCRAALVCGSATPRPESWALERVELPRRVDGRALPEVEVVDMRDRDGRAGPLGERTLEALAELREGGGKAIVLVNRRGWSPHLSCRACGHVWQCPSCDVSLVLHRRTGLHCHHCGHAEPEPAACPACGSVTVARAGSGSERIEALLGRAVEPLPVFRLDSDSAARGGSHLEILEAFQRAEAGVLVGTQMVAKGHDFPDVVLGVVVDADATLRFPDFRAEERTFALVAQLAGRSGRGDRAGRVLVQTLSPGADCIRFAAAHDASGFLAAELARRRELDYPPFSHLIRIELTGVDARRLREAAAALRAALDPELPAGARALGPAPRFRLRGRERRQLLVKARERRPAVAAVRAVVESAAARRELRDLSVAVDVDPQ
jgi:primosomal protein N' (replication factor Y) (superfamily II helicase)